MYVDIIGLILASLVVFSYIIFVSIAVYFLVSGVYDLLKAIQKDDE